MSYDVQIIADSVNPIGSRLTTFVCTFPTMVLAELNTHRLLSRNTSSTRAIPTAKFVEAVRDKPAEPKRFGLANKGMQDAGEADRATTIKGRCLWLGAASNAAMSAEWLADAGFAKQVANRVMSPYMWTTSVITASEWGNFFALRVHEDADPTFQHLAHLMLRAYVAATPRTLAWGEWHVPFDPAHEDLTLTVEQRLKVATARVARVSYTKQDAQKSLDEELAQHDRLAASGHWSPFEACARATDPATLVFNIDARTKLVTCPTASNFHPSWVQYRKSFPGENRTVDFARLLADYEARHAVAASS